MYKLVATDLDGTLLNSNHKISKRNFETIKRLEEAGIIVCLASGRMYKSMLPYIIELGINTKTIAYNGAMIADENSNVIYEKSVPTDFTNEIIKHALEHELHLNYYLDDNLYSLKDDKWLKLYGDRTGMYADIVNTYPTHKPPTKLLIIDEPEKISELYEELSFKFGHEVYVTISNIEYLEFMPKGADKGSALKKLAEFYNIKQEEVIFLGDASNDLPAIEWAGMGIAMNTSPKNVLSAAKKIAPNDADTDGFSIVLEEIFGL